MKTTINTTTLFPILTIMALLSAPLFSASKVKIKLGSLAPEGTPFYDVIHQISNAWKAASDGRVNMKIYAGGVAGSENDMVRKMKIGQLHGASMSAMGISTIDPGYAALQLPALIDSREDLAYYRSHMIPVIEKRLKDKGYITMAHCDMGPLYFFTTKKVTTIEELLKLKICTFSTNSDSKMVWTKAGFNVIDITSNEVLAGLQTGMIEGFIHSPLYALSMQWFAKAKYMVKVNYGYVLAATVIKQKSWDKIPPATQQKLLQIAESETIKIGSGIKKLNDGAVPAMVKHGLEVFTPPEKDREKWFSVIRKAHPEARGTMIPAEVYDTLMSAKAAYITKSAE